MNSRHENEKFFKKQNKQKNRVLESNKTRAPPLKTTVLSAPEVSFATDRSRRLQFGVEVVVDAIKLTHCDPVASPHRKGEEAQTNIGGDIDDESEYPCQGQLF